MLKIVYVRMGSVSLPTSIITFHTSLFILIYDLEVLSKPVASLALGNSVAGVRQLPDSHRHPERSTTPKQHWTMNRTFAPPKVRSIGARLLTRMRVKSRPTRAKNYGALFRGPGAWKFGQGATVGRGTDGINQTDHIVDTDAKPT